jgi:hypothetical protein
MIERTGMLNNATPEKSDIKDSNLLVNPEEKPALKIKVSTKRAKVAKGLFLASSLTVVSVLVSYFLTFTPAPDDRYIAFGIGSLEFTIKPISGVKNSDIWNEALAEGVASWNAVHPDINITISDDSLNRVAFGSMGHMALYSKVCLPFTCNFVIGINDTLIDSEPEWIMYWGRYSIVHELGHALGLKDLWHPNEEISVMSQGNDNVKFPKPSAYDIQSIWEQIERTKNQTKLEQLADIVFNVVESPSVQALKDERAYEAEEKKHKEELAKVLEVNQSRGDFDLGNQEGEPTLATRFVKR